MKPCLKAFSPQTEEQHFQHYLRQHLLACLPDTLRYGVAPDAFQEQSFNKPKRFGQRTTGVIWVIYVKNQVLAHQLRFLAPEVERRFWRAVLSDTKSALPEKVKQRLKVLPRFRLQIQMRADYFQTERRTPISLPNDLIFQQKRFTEQQASDYLQAFLAKRFDGSED